MICYKEAMQRTSALISEDAFKKIRTAHVMLFGLGGVGSYAAEGLIRMGIGRITLVDADTISPSNLNRQLPALQTTIGQPKTEIVAERLTQIAPWAQIETVNSFYLPNQPVPIPDDTDVVLDAIDTVSAKIHIAKTCFSRNIAEISCMGMGNRLDPTKIRIGDLFETSGCPLCRVMRHELRKIGINTLPCIYSMEPPVAVLNPPGSVAFVPSVAGLYMASWVFKFITKTLPTE